MSRFFHFRLPLPALKGPDPGAFWAPAFRLHFPLSLTNCIGPAAHAAALLRHQGPNQLLQQKPTGSDAAPAARQGMRPCDLLAGICRERPSRPPRPAFCPCPARLGGLPDLLAGICRKRSSRPPPPPASPCPARLCSLPDLLAGICREGPSRPPRSAFCPCPARLGSLSNLLAGICRVALMHSL